MSYSNGILKSSIQRGLPGIGFSLTADNHYNINNKKLVNCADGVTDNDCVNKKQLDLKLDKSVFIIKNSIPGIPVLDKISVALIPSLSLLSTDSNDRVSSWFDPVNNISYIQTDNNKKPLLKRDSIKKLFYLEFDGFDDYLIKTNYNVSKLAGANGNTCTVIIIINTKSVKRQSPFQWGTGSVRFGLHIPWIDDNIYIDFGDINNGRLTVSSNAVSNITGNIEVWTIRVDVNNMELFRGTASINPIETESITETLSGSNKDMTIGSQNSGGVGFNFCECDIYGLLIWGKSLSNDELKNMFRFIQDYYNI